MDQEFFQKRLDEELQLFEERTPLSKEIVLRSIETMPGGVPTGVYSLAPYPISMARGKGAYLWDEDGNEYIDYANGFGVSVWGHANEQIEKAMQERIKKGIHFGALSEEMMLWSEKLKERFSLDWLRISNSGTEATMDAIRLARAYTERDKVAKIQGAYHGTHDIALVSANYPEMKEHQDYRFWGKGIPKRIKDEVIPLPFNDLERAKEALIPGDVACFILEPILFNVGAIWPDPGYLEGFRELCTDTGTILLFDETKTGMTIAYGGAEAYFGVKPDLKTSGKGIGGGVSCGMLGGVDSWGYDLIEEGEMVHLGTFPGSPLLASAGLKSEEVMNRSAYEGLEKHRLLLHEGSEEIIKKFSLPAYSIGAGAKNCIVWSDKRLRNFDDYSSCFHGNEALLLSFWMINRGIWLAQGQDEQTTHTIAHGEKEAARFLELFRDFVKEINK